jgi:hypothetical protein
MHMFGHRFADRGKLVIGLALMIAALGAMAGRADAASVHPFVSSFGTGALGDPQAVAVDESTGDVYVLDVSNGTINKFDASGNQAAFSALGTSALDGAGGGDCAGTPADCDETPQGGFAFDGSPSGAQVAVDNSSGPAQHAIYVTNSFDGVVDVFDPTGKYIGQIDGSLATPQSGGEVTGVGVSPSGDVYVSSVAGHVDRYTPADANPADDTFASQVENLSIPGNVAVDSTGAVYVAQYGGFGPAKKYDATQFGLDTPGGSTVDGTSTAVAVDAANDDLYVDEGNQVAQYDAGGTKLGRSGWGTLSGSSFGVAVRGSAGELFASDAATAMVDRFGPAVPVNPPMVSDVTITNVTSSSADFSGTVNPQGTDPSNDTSWHFEYSTDGGASWTNTPQPDADAGTGTSDVPVNRTVSFLPNQPVQVRLVASNQAATVTSSVASFTTMALPPDVTTQPAQDVASTHASLQGLIHPHNAPTTYYFEYGTTAAYGHSIPVSQNGDAGAADLLEAVMQQLYGLAPSTTYHYRLVARSVGGTTTGADQTFTTATSNQPSSCPNGAFRHGAAAALPDCRAWELVSPPDKNGGEVMPQTQRTHAASGATPGMPMAVAFTSLAGFGDVHGFTVTSEYLSQRTLRPNTNGWDTHGITAAQQPVNFTATLFGGDNDPLYEGEFSSDLTHAVFRSWSPLTSAPNVSEVPNLYTRNDLRALGPGSWTLLTNATSPLQRTLDKPYFDAASADFSHVIFESFESLTPEVPPCAPGAFGAGCQPHLYEAVNGAVRLAGILPGNACGSPPCVAEASVAGQGENEAAGDHETPHTISNDGRRVFFTDATTGHLYMRVDGASTVQIDGPETTSAPDPSSYSSTYWDASSDGTRVFFTSGAQLTQDAIGQGGVHLYMYSVQPDGDGHHLTRLDIDREPGDQPNDVQGLIGISNDGHYVYFVAAGQLVAGKPLLLSDRGVYVWHDDGGSPRLDYIGKLAATDVLQNLEDENWFITPKASRVTPDGKHVLFAATDGSGLTGYDQTTACAGDGFDTWAGCTELYVYSVQGDGPSHTHLLCASCNPSGAPATSDATDIIRTEVGLSQPTGHSPRAISDDGRFVFFHTADALVPQDVNGKIDAYAYDTSDGSVHLLSSGADPSNAYFLDASADGTDAFFATRTRLVGWDIDSSRDLYDARVNGGVSDPPAGQVPCVGEACRGPLNATPARPATSNATAGSEGNAAPRAEPKHKRLVCRRGFVRKRVRHRLRCVKRHRRHRRAHRRAHHTSHGRSAGAATAADRKGR